MKTFSAICLALLAGELSASAQGQEKKIEVIVENPWNAEKVDEPVVIDLSSLGAGFTVKSATVFDGTNEIPSQLDDMNGDTRADELAFVINLPASGKKTLNVTLSSLKSDKTYPARVYAEMLLRTSKKNKYAKGYAIYADGASDTYNVQHHHGAAFESELVAYRIYFNEKQTTDLYGKFHKGLELEESQFYPTGEQLKRGFGDDVIKVNSSCGAGTLRGWDGTQSTLIKPVAVRGQRILASGPVRTIVDAEVKGWQYQNKELNMINRYTLYAGHRDAQVDVLFDASSLPLNYLFSKQFTTSFSRSLGNTVKPTTVPPFRTASTVVCPVACNLKCTSQSLGQAGNNKIFPSASCNSISCIPIIPLPPQL